MDESNLSFKSANNTLNMPLTTGPDSDDIRDDMAPSRPLKTHFAVQADESDTIALQQFAYKAKFSEQISKEMRIPKTLAFEADDGNGRLQRNLANHSNINGEVISPTESGDHRRDFANDHNRMDLDMMSVPRKITLDSEENDNKIGLSPIKEINLDNVRNLHAVNLREEPVLLKTPPRVLKIDTNTYNFNDQSKNRPESSDLVGVKETSSNSDHALGLGTPDSLESSEETLRKNDKLVKFRQMSQGYGSVDATNEFLSELLAEDETNANYRKQLFKLTRRIIRLEKENAKKQERQRQMTYVALGVSLAALGVAIFARTNSGYY